MKLELSCLWKHLRLFILLVSIFCSLEAVRAQTTDIQEIPQAALEDKQLLEKIRKAQKEIDQAKEELEQLRKQQATTQKEIDEKRRRENQLNARIQKARDRIQGGKRELDIYRWNLEIAFPRQLENLDKKESKIQSELQQISAVIKYLVHSGVPQAFNPQTAAGGIGVLSQTVLKKSLPSLIDRKRELDSQMAEIEKERKRIQEGIEYDKLMLKKKTPKFEQRKQSVSEAEKNLRQVSQDRKRAQQEHERIKQEIAAKERLFAQMQKKLPLLLQGIDFKTFDEQKNDLMWPVPGRVVNEFGPRKHPQFDFMIENSGIDLAARPQEEVRAVADGTVVYTGVLPGYGSLVMIHHMPDYFTFYTPVQPQGIKEDQRISKGQVIGRVTGNGQVEQKVLHFEVRKGEQAVNPRQWLMAR